MSHQAIKGRPWPWAEDCNAVNPQFGKQAARGIATSPSASGSPVGASYWANPCRNPRTRSPDDTVQKGQPPGMWNGVENGVEGQTEATQHVRMAD